MTPAAATSCVKQHHVTMLGYPFDVHGHTTGTLPTRRDQPDLPRPGRASYHRLRDALSR